MAPKFGTSGLRGLVTELTPDLVADYTRAFLHACDKGAGLYLGRDLRDSSAGLAAAVADAALGEGVPVTDCGALPTPALALAAMGARAAAIMVTGSHIPADRNGLKFYTPAGEITKEDEAAILAALGRSTAGLAAPLMSGDGAMGCYAARYAAAYGGALGGLRIGVWQQSSVARDLLVEVLAACGADVVPLGRSDVFIPVDTEAVESEWRLMFADWVAEHRLDALVSTDGDADRPLVVDGKGRVVPGDVLGALTAFALGADMVVTTVSANTCADLAGLDVIRVRIGSPYVIAAMAKDRIGDARAVGYEPNGGFLLDFEAQGPSGLLAPLMTRDCLLPILAPLAEARRRGLSLAELVATLPARFTATLRLQGIEREAAVTLLQALDADPAPLVAALGIGRLRMIDKTDGWRAHAVGGDIVHLRPSGNAPEFRVYAEAASVERADEIAARALGFVQATLGGY